MGVFAPFAGNLADRFGTARTVGAGGALYVTGMLMIAMASEGVMLTVGNALAGIGMAAAGFGPILGAIGRQTPVEWRSSALGIATAGGSFGQFAIVPFASILQNRLDNWHSTMFVLAAVSVMMVTPSDCARSARHLQRPPVRAGLKAARMRCKKHFALRASGCSLFIALYVTACLNLGNPGSCVSEFVTDSTQNQMTMTECLGVEGLYSAKEFVEKHRLYHTWQFNTPRVSNVILEISVPIFFVVMGRPVVEEIQRAFVSGLDPSRTGRDWFRYTSM